MSTMRDEICQQPDAIERTLKSEWHQAACCWSLISPRYSTVRWTVLPPRHTTVLHDAEIAVILAVLLAIRSPQKHRSSRMPEIQSDEKGVGFHSACFLKSALQLRQFSTRQAQNQRRTAKVTLERSRPRGGRCGVIECGNIGTDAGRGWHIRAEMGSTKYQNSIQNP